MLIILFQMILLGITFVGWGYWIWIISGFEKNRRPYSYFLSMLGGFCACILFLQNLVYCGLQLKWTAWIALIIAAVGCFILLHQWIKGQIPSTFSRKINWVIAVLFLSIFIFQGAGLLWNGPQNYYGNAHHDQVNYTLLSQFLVEEPFSTELKDVGLRPWLVKAIDLKNIRIGESIAQGYLGVVSFTDSKTAYGVLTVSFIALISIVIFILAFEWGLSLDVAFLAGLWTGLLPALTKTHLDGFFSQTIILFIFPTIGLLFTIVRSLRSVFILSILYLAWLLSAYTEVYIIGIAVAACFCFFILKAPLHSRIASIAGIIWGSLLINPYYSFKFLSFLKIQYQVASNPLVLSDLVPYSGTLRGWTEIFWRFDFIDNFFSIHLEPYWVGIFLLFFVIIGFLTRPLVCRKYLLASLLPPISILVYLSSQKIFPKYPFSKILDTFSPFWVLLSTFGVVFCFSLLEQLFRRWIFSNRQSNQKKWTSFSIFLLIPFIIFSGFSSFVFLVRVIENRDILSSVNTPLLRQTYQKLQNTKDRYLINEEHPIVTAWLAYHARKSMVYLESNKITDRPVPIGQFVFRKIPNNSDGLKLVNANGIKVLATYQGPPEFFVKNPQGIDQQGLLTWYWVGDSMDIQFTRFTSNPPLKKYRLTMTAMSGPAHPDSYRKVALISPDGTLQIAEFNNLATLSFTVSLSMGKTIYKFQVLSPKEHVRILSNDPRKHMVRVQDLNLATIE